MKILIVQTGFIGDVILSTNVFRNLRKTFVQAEIHLMTTPEARSLFEAHKDLDLVFAFDKRGEHSGWKGFWKMQKLLKNEKYDLVFSLHKSYRTALLLFLSRIPLRYGFKEAKLSFLYSKTVARNNYSHDALRNLSILENINLKIDELDSALTINFSDESLNEAKKILSLSNADQKIVGIAPGSVWATKRWTKEGFAETARTLFETGHQIVLIGGPNDQELAKEIEKLAQIQILNLTGKTNLATSAAVISQLDLLITNDSAPLHLAAACKTHVLALFCATVPEFGFGPWGVSHINLGVDSLSCRPCSRHGKQHCPTGTHACQKDLLANIVVAAAKQLLANQLLRQEIKTNAVSSLQ